MAWRNLENDIAELFSDVVAFESKAGLRIIAPCGEKAKERWREHARWYRKAFRQKHLAALKSYREANKEELAAYKRAWYVANKERRSQWHKSYWAANKDRINERRRAKAKGIDAADGGGSPKP